MNNKIVCAPPQSLWTIFCLRPVVLHGLPNINIYEGPLCKFFSEIVRAVRNACGIAGKVFFKLILFNKHVDIVAFGNKLHELPACTWFGTEVRVTGIAVQ